MNNFKLKKLAKEIIKLEHIIDNGSPEARSKAENDLIKLTATHNLSLIDMLDLDEMIQNILQKQ